MQLERFFWANPSHVCMQNDSQDTCHDASIRVCIFDVTWNVFYIVLHLLNRVVFFNSQIDLSTATQKLVLYGPSPASSGSPLYPQVPGSGYPGSASPPLQLWDPVSDLAPGASSDDTLHYDVKELGHHACAFCTLLVVSDFVLLVALPFVRIINLTLRWKMIRRSYLQLF